MLLRFSNIAVNFCLPKNLVSDLATTSGLNVLKALLAENETTLGLFLACAFCRATISFISSLLVTVPFSHDATIKRASFPEGVSDSINVRTQRLLQKSQRVDSPRNVL